MSISDDLGGHFDAFLDKCSQETTNPAQEDYQPKLSKQDQPDRSAKEEGSLWPDASVSCISSQSCSRSPANKQSQRTRRRILPLREVTIKMTADTNAEAGLPINLEGDQEADPSPDIKEVTPGTEGTQEVFPFTFF